MIGGIRGTSGTPEAGSTETTGEASTETTISDEMIEIFETDETCETETETEDLVSL